MRGVVLCGAIAVSGCTNTDTQPEPEGTTTASATPAPTSTTTPDATPETPVVSSLEGGSKRLEYKWTTVTATPRKDGIQVKTVVRNTTDETNGYHVEISVGDNEGWLAYNTFRFEDVAPGTTVEQSSLVGGSHLGPTPDEPKIFIEKIDVF
ncbi:hypothetical protein HPT28_25985 [Streptomyces sp. JJ38]|nr:hypothetical protein [Streptomyces sp. JJ38]